MCYQGNCVNSATLYNNNVVVNTNPCIPNPCKNGGFCFQNATTVYCGCGKKYNGI